jgi:ribosomal protein S18 acetylase RimI-like enzyme
MGAAIPIRLARYGDVDDIASLSRAVVEHGLPWRWTPRRVRLALRSPDTNVAVARKGASLLGFGIMRYADDEAHLLLFAVDPAHRRRGVGTRVLEWLEAVAHAASLSRVVLECRRENDSARNFYGARGYHEQLIVERMYSGVEDGITFEKRLT